MPNRAPASKIISNDCTDLVREIITPSIKSGKSQEVEFKDPEAEKVYKFRNTIWNKILSASEFEHFNDQNYFRWLEIYKDSTVNLYDLNPVSIEQKMAMIEVINARSIPKIFNAQNTLSHDVEKLSARKLQKLQLHMKNFDLSSKISREHLESFVTDLMIILKGPPVSLLDYFTQNKTKRMNERLTRMIQEDVLLMGLKGMVERIPEKDSYTRLERGKYHVKHFLQYKIWKYLILPYDLPWFEKIQIPDELLEKILIDGLLAHDQELITHLKKQNMIDHYERFRKVYKPIAFSIGFYFYYDRFSDKMKGSINDDQVEQKEKLIKELTNIASTINEIYSQLVNTKETIQEEHLKRMLQEYKEKYKMNPTKEEYAKMRALVYPARP